MRLDKYQQNWFSRGKNGFVCVQWDYIQATLIQWSPHPFYEWRNLIYRFFGAKIGKGVKIRRTAKCNYPWKIEIGDYSWVGDEATLYSLDKITIGNHVVISQQAYICTGTHDVSDPNFGLKTAPIKIGNGVWIAIGALIMPGVTVGEGAIIGGRAVLTKNAKPYGIYIGAPAKYSRNRKLKFLDQFQ